MRSAILFLAMATALSAQTQSAGKVPPIPVSEEKWPTDPAGLLVLANRAFGLKQWARAIDIYNRLLTVTPGHPVGTRRKAEAKRNLAKRLVVDSV